MGKTRIEWTDYSWNPITGCDPVSSGCTNCYARRMATRLRGRYGYPQDDPFKVTLHPDRLDQPLHWRKPRMIFVCSMGDLFHKDVPLNIIGDVWDKMMEADHHIYIILTKRSERMLEVAKYFCWTEVSHVWLGVSVESQKEDYRIGELLKVPASVIVVSYEPALGSLILPPEFLERGKRSWCVTGGETGPGARPMHPDWPRQVRDDCVAAEVPFFFKSWGEWVGYVQKPSWEGGDLPGALRRGKVIQLRDDLTEDGHFRKGDVYLERVTKKQAGRKLGGKEWNQVPKVSRD